MSMNVVVLLYLVASVFSFQALKGCRTPPRPSRANRFGMVGMAIAMVTTAALIFKLAGESALASSYVLGGLVVGGGIGAVMAKRVEMTKMPELVAFMHSMIGLAAVCIAVAAVVEPYAFGITQKAARFRRQSHRTGARRLIGAITFSGSVIAFGKLSGKYKFRLFQGAPVTFNGQHALNAVLGLATLFFILASGISESFTDFTIICALGFLLGVLHHHSDRRR